MHLGDSALQIDSCLTVGPQGILNSIKQNIGVGLLLKSGIQTINSINPDICVCQMLSSLLIYILILTYDMLQKKQNKFVKTRYSLVWHNSLF